MIFEDETTGVQEFLILCTQPREALIGESIDAVERLASTGALSEEEAAILLGPLLTAKIEVDVAGLVHGMLERSSLHWTTCTHHMPAMRVRGASFRESFRAGKTPVG